MKKKYSTLWIEDGARFDLPYLAAPVYMDGGYDLFVAETIADGIALLQRHEFDAIIMDIRVPPGNDIQWNTLYKKAGLNKVMARLGLKLIYSMLDHPEAEIKLPIRPAWINARKIGVLTVEGYAELEDHFNKLGILVYQQKHANVSDVVLLDLIQQVLQNSAQAAS
jgi:CheY-like chemotaxis protein